MYIRSKKLSEIGHAVSENLRGQNHVRKIEKYKKKKKKVFSWKQKTLKKDRENTTINFFSKK